MPSRSAFALLLSLGATVLCVSGSASADNALGGRPQAGTLQGGSSLQGRAPASSSAALGPSTSAASDRAPRADRPPPTTSSPPRVHGTGPSYVVTEAARSQVQKNGSTRSTMDTQHKTTGETVKVTWSVSKDNKHEWTKVESNKPRTGARFETAWRHDGTVSHIKTNDRTGDARTYTKSGAESTNVAVKHDPAAGTRTVTTTAPLGDGKSRTIVAVRDSADRLVDKRTSVK
jgi:hypothetical protein